MAEKRIDPDDGKAYTFDELSAYYEGKYKKKVIAAYWEDCEVVKKGKGKGKAKAKAKEAPKKKPKVKAKAKTKEKTSKPLKVIKEGDRLPEFEMDLGFPPEKINLAERLKDKKVPEYLKRADELKAKGISEVIVYCVNDAAVMKGWAKDQGIDGSFITFMADPQCKFSRKVGMVINHPGPISVLGNRRCKRFFVVVDNLEVKAVSVSEAEGDPAGDNEPTGPVTAKTRVEHLLTLL